MATRAAGTAEAVQNLHDAAQELREAHPGAPLATPRGEACARAELPGAQRLGAFPYKHRRRAGALRVIAGHGRCRLRCEGSWRLPELHLLASSLLLAPLLLAFLQHR